MSEHVAVDHQHCCDEQCDEEYLPEGVNPMPTELPFEEWPVMQYPPLVFTRWRLPKFLRERGAEEEQEVSATRNGDEKVVRSAPMPVMPWPLRTERPYLRLSHLAPERRLPRHKPRAEYRISKLRIVPSGQPYWRRNHPSPYPRHIIKIF